MHDTRRITGKTAVARERGPLSTTLQTHAVCTLFHFGVICSAARAIGAGARPLPLLECFVKRGGAVVADALGDRALGTTELQLAARALRDLHERGESHGDANLGNFLFDRTVARLIDFDARHRTEVPLPLRAADDLLTLLVDLLGRTSDSEWDRLAHVALAAYGPSSVVLARLHELGNPNGQLARSLLRARAHGVEEKLLRARWERIPRSSPLSSGMRVLSHLQ